MAHIGATSSPGLGPALLGTADPVKFTDPLRLDVAKDLIQKPGGKVIAQATTLEPNMLYTILVVIVSAILFVTVIALFDIARIAIGNYINPSPANSTTSVGIESTGYFALFCVFISFTFVPILCVFIWVIQHRRVNKSATRKPQHHIYV